MIRAHSRLAARNFAISSRKSLCALKKNDTRWPKRSTSSPASIAACTYAIALAKVNATSCTAVDPASRMWYPLIEIMFQLGSSRSQNAKMSVTMRSDARGG